MLLILHLLLHSVSLSCGSSMDENSLIHLLTHVGRNHTSKNLKLNYNDFIKPFSLLLTLKCSFPCSISGTWIKARTAVELGDEGLRVSSAIGIFLHCFLFLCFMPKQPLLYFSYQLWSMDDFPGGCTHQTFALADGVCVGWLLVSSRDCITFHRGHCSLCLHVVCV